jgi:Na+/H+ antiporter NhaD/arsenite permease-like protein
MGAHGREQIGYKRSAPAGRPGLHMWRYDMSQLVTMLEGREMRAGRVSRLWQRTAVSPLVLAVAAVVAAYVAALAMNWPQTATRLIVASEHAAAGHVYEPPPLAMVLPFALLLGAIAVLPLIHRTEHWWESNLHKFYVAAGLGLITLAYYAFWHSHPIERHFLGHAEVEPAATGISWQLAWTVLQNAILADFVPFITLLFALYTITGGIRVEGDLRAHPAVNTAFLAIGGLLASFVGTTGAAMLLIRPLLETNSERKHVQHTVIFFIFIVCNCGGCLLPLGDPPLFLGYLQGVDFLWTMSLWQEWLVVNACLLAIYYVWDRWIAYPRETARDITRDERLTRRLQFSGLLPNVPLLAGVILAVALLDPSKAFPGTHWHPWLYLREVVLLGLVGLSLWLGNPAVRAANKFSYGAILEVAALFAGIFICMQPALQMLNAYGDRLPLATAWHFFWATGTLSSVLDNAPTYLVFLETARALDVQGAATVAGVAVEGARGNLLAAVSLGAVFMGANTYIGNGPNFMVKTIAEKAGVRMPSFFGYLLYSGGVLLPLFILVTLIFF